MLQHLKKKGMNTSQIAKELGRDRKTIRKWLAENGPKNYERKKQQNSILDPYKPYILQRMEEGCLNAAVIFDEIRDHGYNGKIRLLRAFMQPYRPTVISKATERFETPPGQQAQVDWGHFRVNWNGQTKRIYAFVMVLGYSRMMYVEFTEDERLSTLIGCHVRAMEYFGGRPETCLYDNMKTVVIGQDEQGHVVWNERFAKFACHHGFVLKRCAPYRARTKGKVENGVGYLRKNFWPRIRTFTGLAHLNAQVREWMETVANVRIHGTTHEQPVLRWKLENLKPINSIPYEQVEQHGRKVSAESLVSYETNRYSVPFKYIGQTVHVQDLRNGQIQIYAGLDLIALHRKAVGQYQIIVNKKHFEGIRTAGGKTVPQPTLSLVQQQNPKVVERDLTEYEQLLEEVVILQ